MRVVSPRPRTPAHLAYTNLIHVIAPNCVSPDGLPSGRSAPSSRTAASTAHYAKTLWHWCDRLEANADAARAEVGEEKHRVWRIYLAGSAHAFDRGWLSLWQLLAGKPLPDGRLPNPLTRDYMYAPGG